jgi:hypothetical protein
LIVVSSTVSRSAISAFESPCGERVVDVLVEVERRQDQHARRAAVGDLARGGDPVELGHADVHEHDVGREAPGAVDRLAPRGRLADDLDVGLRVQHHAEAGAGERVIVDEQDADAHAASGIRARTTKPRPATGRASSSPP